MFKIAILGVENSHANSFMELINEGKYPDFKVVGVYSDDNSAIERFLERYTVPVMENYDSLVGKVDGIMVTARHGKNHYKYAKPYIKTGIPMFIDKPITVSISEAEEFMSEAKKHGVKLCGGSTCAFVKETQELGEIVRSEKLGKCIGGSVLAPIRYWEQYGGFFFYAQHLVQMVTKVFGSSIEKVYAEKDEQGYSVSFKYADFVVSGRYADMDCTKMNYFYISAYGSNGAESVSFTINTSHFNHEMQDMCDLLNGKEQKETYEEFIYPVYVMNALHNSISTKKWEKVMVK